VTNASRQRLLGALVGGGYGVALGISGVLCAAGGHGTYIPVALYGAPLTLVGIPAAILGAPVIWAALGFLVVDNRRSQSLPVALACAQYLTAIAVWAGLGQSEFSDWGHLFRTLHRLGLEVLVGVGLYGGGQYFFWRRILAKPRGPEAAPEVGGG
jgi:hypothetical protein